jgi:ABC-2 type transport system permease protein
VDALLVDGRTIVTSGTLDPDLGILLQQAHQAAQLEAAGVRLTPLEVQSTSSAPPGQTFVATILTIVLFILILYTSLYVAVGVVEEKSGRIVELLLSSLRPWQILSGKIIGLIVLALINVGAVLATGLGATLLAGETTSLPSGFGGIVANAILWFVVGCIFFAALSAMFGSLVSRQEDLNSVLTPLMLLLMSIYLLSFFVAGSPRSPVAQIFSMIPPFSTMVMPVRYAVDDVPLWQFAVAWLLMLVATAVITQLAGRIYRRAVLRTGARLKLSQLWKASQP